MEYLAYSEVALANTEPTIEIRLPKIQLKFNWHHRLFQFFRLHKSFKSSGLIFASFGVLFAITTNIQQAVAAYTGPGIYYIRTNGSCLNIRSGPGINYRSVACYRNGSRLPQIVGYRNGFAQLSTGYYTSAKWINTAPGVGTSPGGVGGVVLLRPGSRGSAVVTVQRALGVTPTGYYGPTTTRVVRNYQARRGLIADGIVGPQTRRALGIY